MYVNTERAIHTLYTSSTLLQCLRIWYLRPPANTTQRQQPREMTSDLALTPGLTPGVTPGIGDDLVDSPFTAGLIAGVMGSQMMSSNDTLTENRLSRTSSRTSNRTSIRTSMRDDGLLSSPLVHLTCKSFFPLRSREGGIFEDTQYESMSETKIRMKQWLKANSRKLNAKFCFCIEYLIIFNCVVHVIQSGAGNKWGRQHRQLRHLIKK